MTTIKKNVKMCIPQALSPEEINKQYMGFENEPVRPITLPRGGGTGFLYRTGEGEYKLAGGISLTMRPLFIAMAILGGLVAAGTAIN